MIPRNVPSNNQSIARYISRYCLAAVLGAAIMVGIGVLLRWNGTRTAYDAYVPLRPLTVIEAAALLDAPDTAAAITAMDRQNVQIVTDNYLLPVSASAVEGTGTISIDGVVYMLHRTNWNGLVSLYRVDRAALEQRLGRSLGPLDNAPGRFAGRPISFDSSLLWLYVAIEIAVLAACLAAVPVAIRLTQRRMVAIPAAGAVALAIVLFVPRYAPAVIDADSFYQRIVLEHLLVPAALTGPAFLVATLVLAIHHGVKVYNRAWHRKFRFTVNPPIN